MIATIFLMQTQFIMGVVLLLILRPLLKKFPRVISYALWCLLFLRLLCPFSLSLEQAPWSVSNLVQSVEQTLTASESKPILNQQNKSTAPDGETKSLPAEQNKEIQEKENDLKMQKSISSEQGKSNSDNGTTIDEIPQKPNKSLQSDSQAEPAISEYQKQTDIRNSYHQLLTKLTHWCYRYKYVLLSVWLLGLLIYLAHYLRSFQQCRAYAETAVACPGQKGIYESEHAGTPYVFGVFHIKIILPQHLEGQEREYIICHERMHIRRKDYILKWIVFLLTGIWWFQPFVWIAAYFMEQDMEMSCDEAVICKMGEGIKKEYARSLLSFAQGRESSALPLTFASGSVKKRIYNVLHMTLLKVWMIPIAAILILSMALLIFTAQEHSGQKNEMQKAADNPETKDTTSTEITDIEKLTQTEETKDSDIPLEQRIDENFGFFSLKNNLKSSYKLLDAKRYQKYRFDDLSAWKKQNGDWKYPAKYKLQWIPSDPAAMASQQFPETLLEEMSTEELYTFIMKAEGVYNFNVFDSYLSGLSGYYSYYNFIHALMNREDCAQIIHKYYSRYSEDEKKKYSKMYHEYRGEQEDFQRKRDAFQLTEAMEWFFLALNGKNVPDETVYHQGLLNEKPPEGMQYYEYMADITHDGKEDTIILDTTALTDESKASGNEKTVIVKSGATGKEIASYTANTVHGGWNGIYVYTDDTGDYLVTWQPAMYQGVGSYMLKVFSLNEKGNKDVLFRKEYQFDLNPGHFHFNPDAYLKYIDKVNSYLKKSYVIIDTDQGRIEHSIDTKQYGYYDSSETMERYRDYTNTTTAISQ